MTVTQLHFRLRGVLNHRIQRGTMSGKLLASLTGLGRSQVSNFLHGQRRLSIDSMDRVLKALSMGIEMVPLGTNNPLPHVLAGGPDHATHE